MSTRKALAIEVLDERIAFATKQAQALRADATMADRLSRVYERDACRLAEKRAALISRRDGSVN